MTARVPLEQKRRPRRELGDVLTLVLNCPLCSITKPYGTDTRVVAYRRNTVRLECRDCGLRFSVNWFDVAQRLLRDGAHGWGEKSATIGAHQAMQAFEAGFRALGIWESFLERCEAHNDGAIDNGVSA